MVSTRRLITIVLLIVAALALGGTVAAAAHGATAEELQQKLEAARKKIAAAEDAKASLNEQISDLDGRLSAIQKKLDGLGEQIAGVEEKLTVTRDKLEVLRDELRLKKLELAEAQAELELEQDNFAQRAVLTYKSDDLDYVDVLLSSTDFEDLISRVNTIHDLLGGNNALVGDLEGARDEVDAEKDAIAKREKAVADAAHVLQVKSDELAALKAQQAASQAAAWAVRQEKKGALKGVNKDLAELERQESQILAESQALTGVVGGSGSTGSGNGSLSWPVRRDRGLAVRLSHPPDPRLQEAAHRHRHRRGVRRTHPLLGRRHRHLRLVDGWLRQRDHRRPRRRALDALRAPVEPRRGQRRACGARPDHRLRGLDGVQHRPAPPLRGAGQRQPRRPDGLPLSPAAAAPGRALARSTAGARLPLSHRPTTIYD